MTNHHADDAIVSEIETVRLALPTWVISTVELVELAENAERAARDVNPATADRSRKLIVEVAEWQQKTARLAEPRSKSSPTCRAQNSKGDVGRCNG